MTHPHLKGNFVPKAVLMKSGLKTLNTARQNSSKAAVSVNTARPINTAFLRPTVNCAKPASNVFNRAQSYVKSPFNKFITNKNSNFNEKVNIVKGNVTTAWLKAVIMKKLMEDLLPLEEVPNEGKLLGKKSSVLFTDTECVVLSPDFKLTDESHVLLKVPRKDNMYSINLKNVVPQRGLTCLFVKATTNESNLWHRRLRHKGKQHIASCKTKTVRSISQPLQMLHMDLFGPIFEKSLMKKMYCLVVTDDYSRFSWVFFLATKDETSEILKAFITGIENLIDLKVKVIRCDSGTEFKNKVMNQFCEMKGRKPALSFMRSFGCPVTILNTIDHLGKFDGKADEGFFVGYSTNSKAFRAFNSRTRIVEESLHVKFSEDTPNITGSGPKWLFDIDALTKSMNYEPVVAGNQSNGITGKEACENAGKASMETVPGKDYILLPLWTQNSPDAKFKPLGEEEKKDVEDPGNENSEVPSTEEPRVNQEKDENVNNTNNINIVISHVNAGCIENNIVDENIVYGCDDDPNMPNLEEIVYSDDDDVGAEADMTNLDTHILASPIPTT
ncbi:putative ribonuclease H-like domain-containing protein [Tanacetum coccineum]